MSVCIFIFFLYYMLLLLNIVNIICSRCNCKFVNIKCNINILYTYFHKVKLCKRCKCFSIIILLTIKKIIDTNKHILYISCKMLIIIKMLIISVKITSSKMLNTSESFTKLYCKIRKI